MEDDFSQDEQGSSSITCDLCGQKMYKSGGCFICTKCGQKKCNTDIT